MSWNYRIIKHLNGEHTYYAIHEVYYTDGIPDACTACPAQILGENPQEILSIIETMKTINPTPIDMEYFDQIERKNIEADHLLQEKIEEGNAKDICNR